ncbi:MAG: hypothetical protein KAT48_03180, partial [Bacteroidales bacterium]|nr:hypothetical protein [Bacteroidales bacterium]
QQHLWHNPCLYSGTTTFVNQILKAMNSKTFILAGVLLLAMSQFVIAQDQIHKRNNEIINCKIKELGSESVKYLLPDYPDDVSFSIDNDKILKIVFENGKEHFFQKEMFNPENYVDDRKNAIKLDFISPLTGNTTFAYERSIKPGQSFEVTLGIIGMGFDPNDENARGAFTKFGYKFIKTPDFYFNKMRYAHILKGSYIKPEISFGYYSHTDYYKDSWEGSNNEREPVVSGSLHLVLGKQWVYSNVFLVDFSVGVGYGFDNIDGGYHYGYATSDGSFPISGSANLKVGYLF